MNKIIVNQLIRKEKFHLKFPPDLLFFLIFFDQQLKWIPSLLDSFFVLSNIMVSKNKKVFGGIFQPLFYYYRKKTKNSDFFYKKIWQIKSDF